MVDLYGRVGGETLVNTVTAGEQSGARIDYLTDGRFVVTWTDKNVGSDDASGWAVRGQIFLADGTPSGSAFLVNANFTGNQYQASIVGLANGGFAIAWTDATGDAGTGASGTSGIKVQLFDSTGAKSGSEFLANAAIANAQTLPVLAATSDGGFVLSWTDASTLGGDTSGTGVKARIYDSTGSATTGELLVNTSITGPQYNSSVTVLGDGKFVVAWADTGSVTGSASSIDANDQNIKAQMFSADGSKFGSEFTVNTIRGGTLDDFDPRQAQQLNPNVTALANGGYVITWEDWSGLSEPDFVPIIEVNTTTDFVAVKGQVYDAGGNPVGGEFLVNTETWSTQWQPVVTALSTGQFVVAWDDYSGTSGETVSPQTGGIKAQVFNADGSKDGAEFLVNTNVVGNETTAAIAANSEGGFSIVWNDTGSTVAGPIDVKLQVFAPTTGMIGDIGLSNATISENEPEHNVVGNFSVAGIVNARVASTYSFTILSDSTGGAFAVDGDKLVVADNAKLDYETQPNAHVEVRVEDGNGNFYIEMLNIGVTDVANEYLLKGGATQSDVNTTTAGHQRVPEFARLPNGGFVATWMDSSATGPDTSGNAIKAQLYDADGNKVGGEFLVNTVTAGSQDQPDVAVTADGFFVAWQSVVGQNQIHGQYFDTNGNKLGLELTISTAANAQTMPSVAQLSGGDVVVGWTDATGSNDAKGRIVHSDGTMSSVIPLATVVTLGQSQIDVTGLSGGAHDGGFVAAWNDATAPGTIKLRMFDSAGNPITGETVANTNTAGNQTLPQLASLTGGGFVVTWFDQSNAAPDTQSGAVRARIFDADGNPTTGEFLVNTTVALSQSAPDVAVLSTGEIVFTWQDASTANTPDIKGQLFDTSGNKLGAEFLVNLQTLDSQQNPTMAALGDGSFVIGWEEVGAGFTGRGRRDAGSADTSYTAVKLRVFSPSDLVPTIDLNGADSGNDSNSAFTEHQAPIQLNTASIVIADADGDDIIGATVDLTDARPGDHLTVDGSLPGGITYSVTESGGHLVLTLSGTASAADYAAALEQVRFANDGDDPTLGGTDTARIVEIQVTDAQGGTSAAAIANIAITGVNSPPELSGTPPYVEFTEGGAPVLVAPDVNFSDPDLGAGTTLTVGGVGVDDRVEIQDEGSGAGQIAVSGADISYGGTLVGTASGGNGSDLIVTFNANASAAAVEAVIEHLTYRNVSEAPMGTTLTLTVTDDAGAQTRFDLLEGAGNPFDAIQVGGQASAAFMDVDENGTMDLVVGGGDGGVRAYANDGAGHYTLIGGVQNPFASVVVGSAAAVAAIDLNFDGRLDLVVGTGDGHIQTYLFDPATLTFVPRTGASNPFDSYVGDGPLSLAVGDVAGDSTIDLVIGTATGDVDVFIGDGSDLESGLTFTFQNGLGNLSPIGQVQPLLVDIDNDGDLDFIQGDGAGNFYAFSNDGGGSWSQLADASNPLYPFAGSQSLAPYHGDVNGDFVDDYVLATDDGRLIPILNTPNAIVISAIGINDAPTVNGATASLGDIAEDDVNSAGDTVQNLFESHFVDADSGFYGIVVTGLSAPLAGEGRWQYNDGNPDPITASTWHDLPAVSDSHGFVLSGDYSLRFVPAPDYNGTPPSLIAHLYDGGGMGYGGAFVDISASGEGTGQASGYSVDTVALGLSVTPVQDAPRIYDTPATLDAIAEDDSNPPGATVATIFGPAFTDPDGDTLAGVAITNNPASVAEGVWQYFDAGVWTNVGTPSEASALVLSAAAAIRFVPAVDFNGTAPALSAYLIDSSGGAVANASGVDVSMNGGATRYSDEPVDLVHEVGAVNDAPVATIAPPALDRIGGEILVNTATASQQLDQKVVALDGGGWVVTWRDFSQSAIDGGHAGTDPITGEPVTFFDSDIKAQVFDAAGNKTGGEILVNAFTYSDQSEPVIAPLTGGSFAIAWYDFSTVGDASQSAIKAQIFTATGVPVGSEISVNSATASFQGKAVITALSNGGFAIAWQDASAGVGGATGDSSTNAIKAQVYGATGTPVGTEILVNTTTNDSQQLPRIVTLDQGKGLVIVWTDESQTPGPNHPDVRAQVFTEAGVKIGGEILVSASSAGGQSEPQVTALEGGRFAVTWSDGIGSAAEVHVQLFSETGAKIGSETQANSATVSAQDVPQVTALEGGGFIVTWNDASAGTGGATGDTEARAVKGQLYDSNGAKIGQEILVNTGVASEQLGAHASALPGGGFVIVWSDMSQGVGGAGGDASGYAIKAQYFAANGAKLGGEILVNSTIFDNQVEPQVTTIAGGSVAIVWSDYSGQNGDAAAPGIRAQLLNYNGGAGYSAVEQIAYDLKDNGLSIADPDAGGGTMTVTLSVGYGILNVAAGSSGATVTNSGTAAVTISGSVAQINALLNSDASSSVAFIANSDAPPASTVLTLLVDDNGNSGGGAQSASTTATIFITGVNDPAVITGTAAGAVAEDGTLVATHNLTVTDPDGGADGSLQPVAAGTAGDHGYGTFEVLANGQWTYTLNNASGAVQALPGGVSVTDTITVLSADGGASQEIVVTISGANDGASITGTATGDVIEDGALTDSDTLTISDVDTGENQLQPVAAGTAGANGYGTFEVLASGQWTYTLDNGDPAVEALGATGTLTDTIDVLSEDGTATREILVTIHGANDAATINGTATGTVTEDGPLTVTQSLSVADVDTGENALVPIAAGAAGAQGHGTFEVLANGQWTYTLNNADPAVQALPSTGSLTDSILVSSLDGSATRTIQVTINGANDAPTIGGVAAGDVTEDAATPNLTSSGALTITDPDTGQASFVAQASTLGSNGIGTFSLLANGQWSWSAANSQTAIQQLAAGQTTTDSFTAVSLDGSASRTVTVTIHGVNDTPDISNVATDAIGATLAESNAALSTTGTLSLVDPDLTDNVTASVTGVAVSGTISGLVGTPGSMLSVTAGPIAADPGSTHNLGWSFDSGSETFDYLAAGQSVTFAYTVRASDGAGAFDDQLVTITIQGSNDGPAITSAPSVSATLAEDSSSPTLAASGLFNFADFDLSDAHSVSVAAPTVTSSAGVPAGFVPAGGFGTLMPSVVEDTSDTSSSASVIWNFAAANSAVQGLALGETVTQVYAVTVQDASGAMATQNVTITLTGTNDAPSLVAATDVTGALTEDGAVTDTGAFTFQDADLSNAHSVAVGLPTLTSTAGVPLSGIMPVGTLSASVAETLTDLSTGAAVNWSFTLAPSEVEWLAAGETLTQTYQLTLSDGAGSSFVQSVEVTIAGTNDAPTLSTATDVAGAVSEDGAAVTLTDGGSFVFQDLDLSNSHSVAIGTPAVTGSATIPAGLVPAGGFGALTASVSETVGDFTDTGTVNWSFSVDNAMVQSLSAGETVTQVYTLTLTDTAGTSVTQDVTVTITGANDGPTLVIATDVSGAVTEDAAMPTLGDSGSFRFADVDLSDAHSTIVSAPVVTSSAGVPAGFVPAGGIGSLSASVFETLTDLGNLGVVSWTFSAANAAVQGLAAGETITQVYTITLRDASGASFDQDVTVSITGTNDAPIVTAATDVTGAVTEHQSSPDLTDNGSFAFQDVDLSNSHGIAVGSPAVTHSANVPGAMVPAGGLGTLTANVVEDASDLDDNGTVQWSFSVADAAVAFLGNGETVTQVYTLTLTDSSGASVSQDVTVTITGSNEAPIILGSTDAFGMVAELPDHDPAENVATLSDSGTIFFADSDVVDTHSASAVALSGGYLGAFSLGSVDQAGDSVGWSFSISDAALNSLGYGVVVKQYYTVTIDDGQGGTADQIVEIDLVGTNDAAVMTFANVILEQGPVPVSASGDLDITDEDDPALFIVQSNVAGSYGHFSIDANGNWSYVADTAYILGPNDALSDVFTVLAQDGTPTTVAVTIRGSDQPGIARNDQFSTNESSLLGSGLNLFNDNGNGADTNPDSALVIGAVNGNAANVGHSLLLASGGRVIVNSNGTFSYDTNTAWTNLSGLMGASNHFGHDSFTYTLAGGDSATVAVNIVGQVTPGDISYGSGADDNIIGSSANDTIRLDQSGHDHATGEGGNDGFYFGSTLDHGDSVDGGSGNDTVALQGGLAVALGDINNVEVIALLSGSNATYGDIANNRYDYDLTTNDGNVAAGQTLTVIGTALLPGEDIHFDGSAESDGNFRIFAGQGVDDLTGGSGNDGFFFGADHNLTGADHVDGGAGTDSIALRGNYVGANAVVFTDASLSNIEVLALLSGHTNEYGGVIVPGGYDYDVTMANGNVAAGQILDVSATGLKADESVRFDGRAETDGAFRILSGAGNDTLYGGSQNDTLYGGQGKDWMEGGAGADTYIFRSASESTGIGYDTISGFDYHADRIDAPGGGSRGFSHSATGNLSLGSFDADLATGMSGVLGAGQAALFTASGGSLSGHVFAVIDVNGVAGYQSGEDLVIELINPVLPIDPMAGVIL